MTTRRTFFGQMATALAMQAQDRPRPRNVLLMVADDLGLHTGAYGDKTAVTPHLDRLAGEGVRFSHAFCTTASCSASRSVLLSGLHNHANGHYGHAHAEHNMNYLPPVRPLPRLLRESGYATGVIGKLHVNPLSAFPWDVRAEGETRNVVGMAAKAREFVQKAGERPWFLLAGFGDPHRAGDGFANRDYPKVERRRFDPEKVALPAFLPDNRPVREEVAEYYEACHRLDQGVGRMLDLLRETGQADRTLVIFLSDNGMPFPNAKTNLYEGGVRLPLIVRSPAQTRRGLVSRAMANWTDVTPTILDWTGAKPPGYPLHGRSLLPVLEQESPAGWEEVYLSHTFHEVTMYYPTRGVRTRRHKYLRNLFPELSFPFSTDLWASKTWQSVRREGTAGRLGQRTAQQYLHRPAEELYDLETDPQEVRNLAGEAAHRDLLLSLRRKVETWRKETKDPWLVNDEYGGAPA